MSKVPLQQGLHPGGRYLCELAREREREIERASERATEGERERERERERASARVPSTRQPGIGDAGVIGTVLMK